MLDVEPEVSDIRALVRLYLTVRRGAVERLAIYVANLVVVYCVEGYLKSEPLICHAVSEKEVAATERHGE